MKKFMETSADGKHVVFNILGIRCKFKTNKPFNQLEQLKRQMYKDNQIIIDDEDKHNIILNLDDCHNNKIIIGKLNPLFMGKLILNLHCDDSEIIIDPNLNVSQHLNIHLGFNHFVFGKAKNIKVRIGGDSSFEQAVIQTYNSNTVIEIGSQCMFSYNVEIIHTDAHPIFSTKTNEMINLPKKLTIGNHCWIGAGVTILKNSTIADGCIIGRNATVVGKFVEPNCAIAGNSARIIKKDVRWEAESNNGYIQNEETVECGS